VLATARVLMNVAGEIETAVRERIPGGADLGRRHYGLIEGRRDLDSVRTLLEVSAIGCVKYAESFGGPPRVSDHQGGGAAAPDTADRPADDGVS